MLPPKHVGAHRLKRKTTFHPPFALLSRVRLCNASFQNIQPALCCFNMPATQKVHSSMFELLGHALCRFGRMAHLASFFQVPRHGENTSQLYICGAAICANHTVTVLLSPAGTTWSNLNSTSESCKTVSMRLYSRISGACCTI